MAHPQRHYQPQPRDRHLAVPVGKKLYTWGGFLGFESSSEDSAAVVEVFDNSTELWEQKSTHGSPPKGLWSSAYTAVGSTIFSIGGVGGGVNQGEFRQLETDSLDWMGIEQKNPSRGPKKSALANSGMVPFQSDKLAVLATTLGEEGKEIDELHLFKRQEGTWMTVPTTGTKPPACAHFSFTQISDSLAVFFGGSTTKGYLNGAYILDLDKRHWTKLDVPEGPIPPPRAYHAVCCIAGPLTGQEHPLLLVIGGRGERRKVLDDVWLLDINGKRWIQVALPKSVKPRHGHTATVFGSSRDFRQVVIWGGKSSITGEPLAETTLLDLELRKGSWKVVNVITQEELGRSATRLRDKAKRLWNTPESDQPSQEDGSVRRRPQGDGKGQRMARIPQRAQSGRESADHHARRLEKRISQAELETTVAWQEVELLRQQLLRANSRVLDTEGRLRQVEADARGLEDRLRESEQARREAEKRASLAETRATEATQFRQEEVREAERRAQFAEGQLRRVLGESRHLDVHSKDHFWVVQRDEIELTAEQLGKGGWGVVYIAKFRGLNVAAKHLHGLIVSDYNRQLFMREMTIAARLQHPNLIQFLGATVEGTPVILTELMETSLRAVLEQRALDSQEAAGLSLDIARALNYLHLIRPDPIIHRDISSANVLLEAAPNNTWKTKVADLGSANFVKHISTAGPGSPAYAAPEAVDPSRQSPKMDVYSYGILLLEMYTRRFPETVDLTSQLDSIGQPRVVRLIRECIEYNPKGRPTMNTIVAQLQ